MALVVCGRIVPMANDPVVAPDESAAFRGRVWIGDDGLVTAVSRGRAAGPAGFPDAPVVEVGDDLVLPGLIDLHNHLAYNTLPLWEAEGRSSPFPHHDSWPGHKGYAPSITWPAYALITAAPQALLAYVETKAIVGGTTTIQGSPPKNRPRDGWLVRNVEDEKFDTRNPDLVYASTLTLDSSTLAALATAMRTRNALFIYHCSEGQRGSLVAREFRAAAQAGCLQGHFVAVHCNAIDPAMFASWRQPGAVVWSPLSNFWLYGQTTDVPAARDAGVTVCLGSDWTPSGSRNVLGELKAARVVADAAGWGLSDADLVRMVTCNPGDVLARGWPRQVGRLQPGAVADLTVVSASRRADPFSTLVRATEKDVRLVVVDGQARYGTPQLMSSAKAGETTTVRVAGESRRLALRRSDEPAVPWAWEEVVERLEAVRADPRSEIERARSRIAASASAFGDVDAPLRLALDMPTGLAPVGGLPKDLGVIRIPSLDPLDQDGAWARSLHGRAFHGGVLDPLVEFYR